MPYKYRPILRSKAGEAGALNRLSPNAKARTIPLITLLPKPPASFATTMGAAWSGFSMGLDGQFNGVSFKTIFQELGKAGVAVMPVVSPQASPLYVAAALKLVGQFAPGAIVTVTLADLATAGSWVASHGLQQSSVDLVLWLGDAASFDPGTFHSYVSHGILSSIGAATAWRSITVAAASAPQDHSGLVAGRTDVPRRDWNLWVQLTSALPFALDFGDTGHVHPSLEEPPGYAMARATVSVRYTIDGYWIVLKGRPTRGATGQPMDKQYLSHARTLVKDKDFDQLPYCWADDQIKAIASSTTTSGSRTTWATIGMNRHIEFVANRLP